MALPELAEHTEKEINKIIKKNSQRSQRALRWFIIPPKLPLEKGGMIFFICNPSLKGGLHIKKIISCHFVGPAFMAGQFL